MQWEIYRLDSILLHVNKFQNMQHPNLRTHECQHVEDVDSRSPDHAADAVRYRYVREAQDMIKMGVSGI